MSVSRTSLLALASLLPIALATPALATNDPKTGFVVLDRDTPEVAHRDIGGTQVATKFCNWYNFHQSISLWPVYKDCAGKTAVQWRDKYHSKNNDNGFSDNAQALIARQNTTSHDAVFTDPDKHIRLEIDKHYDRTACAWFNYIHSRVRTPLYLKCKGKDNQASYGMYTAPDFLKNFSAPGTKEQEWAYDRNQLNKPAPVLLNERKFNENVTRKLGRKEITLTRCEWSNFFQSISFLPRYLACPVSTNRAQLSNYEKNKNLNKIKFKFIGDASSRDDSQFSAFLTLKVATQDVKATACEWYNLVQSQYRWPIYERCPTVTSDRNYVVETVIGPKRDFYIRHKLLYKD